MGADVAGNFVGDGIDFVEVHVAKQAVDEGGGEGVSGADSVDDFHGMRGAVGPAIDAVLALIEQAAVGSAGEGDELEVENLGETFNLVARVRLLRGWSRRLRRGQRLIWL